MLYYLYPRWKTAGILAWSLSLIILFAALFSRAPDAVSAQTQEEEIPLPVIMYHHILENSKLLGMYVITPEELRNDFQWIKEKGYTPIVVADLLDYVYNDVPLPEKPIMITFDDGYESNYAYAYPLLQEYGYKAVISIFGRCTDEFTVVADKHLNYSHITWEEIREMASSGLVEFQNHTYDMHSNAAGSRKGIQKLYIEDEITYRRNLTEDVGKLQQEFIENLGYAPTAFTYPFGYLEPSADEILRDMGFLASFSCEERIHYISKDPECLYKIRRFNRPHNIGTADFFERMESTAKKRAA